MGGITAGKAGGFTLSAVISAFTVLPIGMVLIFGSLASLVAIFTSDWVLMAIILGAIIGGAVVGALVGGYLGINSKAAGAGTGIVTALCMTGFYVLYAILTGALGLVFGSMDTVLFSIVLALLVLVTLGYSFVVFLIGQHARK